ncbi:MAG: ATP-binding protein [Candidatus Kapabacteria bacterium]|nr:ATP-binding protein [Candidatus Kapabacteria bacterium]
MSDPHTFSLSIPSERTAIRAVEPFLRSTGVPDVLGPRYGDLLVTVTEAVNNGIIHGNTCDAAKPVQIDVQVTMHDVIVAVRDAGAGFDVASVPDPRLPERLLLEGGRGVFLIRQLSDASDFMSSATGTTVFIKFLLR